MRAVQKVSRHLERECTRRPAGRPLRDCFRSTPEGATCTCCFQDFKDDEEEVRSWKDEVDPIAEFNRIEARPAPGVTEAVAQEMVARILQDLGWEMARAFCLKNDLALPPPPKEVAA